MSISWETLSCWNRFVCQEMLLRAQNIWGGPQSAQRIRYPCRQEVSKLGPALQTSGYQDPVQVRLMEQESKH